MLTYKLSYAAEADLREIWTFGFQEFGETRADQFLESLFHRFKIIADSPLQCPSVEWIRNGYRRCVARGLSIFYRIEGETVQIIRVIGKQVFQ